MKDNARSTGIDSSLSGQSDKGFVSQTVRYTRSGAVDTEYYMKDARRLRVEALRMINTMIYDAIAIKLRKVATPATRSRAISWLVQGKRNNNRNLGDVPFLVEGQNGGRS